MIHSRIAEQRKKLGLSQEELATKLKISQKSISKYERGDRRPSYETLVAMSSIFDVSIDYLLGNDTQDGYVQNNSTMDKVQNPLEEKYFFFFFNEENLLRDTFANRIKSAIADTGLSEDDFKKTVPIGTEKATSFLECKGEPTANDLIQLSQFLDTSIDYLLGQIPKLNRAEKKLLNSFVKLDSDRKDIIIGKTKELLIQQENSSVAADEPLKKTGTTNSAK